MSEVTRALGTTLSKGTVPTLIGGLTSIGGIEITADTADVTTLDSVGGYREFKGTFKDAGEVPIEGFFDHTAAGQLSNARFYGCRNRRRLHNHISNTSSNDMEIGKGGVVTSFGLGDAEA